MLGWTEVVAGDSGKGMEYLHRALRTNPRDPAHFNTYHHLASAYFLIADYVKAIEFSLLAISEAPAYAAAYMILAVSEAGSGDLEKAASALETARRLAPEFIQNRLDGGATFRKPEHLKRFTTFLRVAAGLEDPSAADALR